MTIHTPPGSGPPAGSVVAVCAGPTHAFSKPVRDEIRLLAGQGVAGDAHCGATVRHRSRVALDPGQPNLRQVHLLQSEAFDALASSGFQLGPGDIGGNVTTRGIDLLGLPTGTLLSIGATAVLRLTGLRDPCTQMDRFQSGLMAATLERDALGRLLRKAGVMAVVVREGTVRSGDAVVAARPSGAWRALEPV